MLMSFLDAFGFIRSPRGDRRLGRLERGLGLLERDLERDMDLEGEREIVRLLRDFVGGERLLEVERERLRLRVGGERERELVEYDLLRRLARRKAGEGERVIKRAGWRRAGGVTDALGERRRRSGDLDLDNDRVRERFAEDGDLLLGACLRLSRPRGTYESLTGGTYPPGDLERLERPRSKSLPPRPRPKSPLPLLPPRPPNSRSLPPRQLSPPRSKRSRSRMESISRSRRSKCSRRSRASSAAFSASI